MLERAREFLGAAEGALEDGRLNACALCCYAALFWAAIAALEPQGFKREEWSHGALKVTFTNELIKRGRSTRPCSAHGWAMPTTHERQRTINERR